MTTAATDVGQPVLERMATLCASTFALVEGLRGVGDQLLQADGSATPRQADVAAIIDVVGPLLRAPDSPVVGAGLVMATGVVSDAVHCLEWWTSRPGSDDIARVEAVLDEDSDDFYDYTALPWFVVPEQTGLRHITGPYVDWLCTDEYTLTFTAPVFGNDPVHGRRFLGVVGADVVNSWVERQLLPLLHRSPRASAVVNRQGRVVVANRTDLVTGSVVHHIDVTALWNGSTVRPAGQDVELHTLTDLPFALLQLGPDDHR